MKRNITSSTSAQQGGALLLSFLADYIGSDLVVDEFALSKYPQSQWSEISAKLYKEQVDESVHSFLAENFSGWFEDRSDEISDAVWDYLESSPEYDLYGENE